MAVVERKEHVVDIRCESAAEFMEVLNPVNGTFAFPKHSNLYIYRGVGASKFELVPSAFRAGSYLAGIAGYERAPRQHCITQCLCELLTLRKFFEIADRHGVRMPDDSPVLRAKLDEWQDLLTTTFASAVEPITWPPPEFYSLIGLAQHYRVPTRALDWTWSSLTAAYFAATEANPVDDERLAVWAYSRVNEQLDQYLVQRDGGPKSSRSLVVFTAPGADNANLRAQRGLFMLYSQRLDAPVAPFVVQNYDGLLMDSLPAIAPAVSIYKITAPSAERKTIMAALSAAGVTTGALFPGLWGVAREYEEQRSITDLPSYVPRTSAADRVADQLLELGILPGA